MLKLKIGDNYLITTNSDCMISEFIVYTMGCFKLHNKVLLGLDYRTNFDESKINNYIKAIKEAKALEVYVLWDKNWLPRYEVEKTLSTIMRDLCSKLPAVKLNVVKIASSLNSREFKIAEQIYDVLKHEDGNILGHLSELEEYKDFANRYKSIPAELKVINESIEKLSKEEKICNRVITLEDLKYLNLIEAAELNGNKLILTIKPLPIYPSEDLGKCISKNDFKSNKYLAKAAEYLYKGCHFGMPGTRIAIYPNFRPEFIETVDHQFDDMFMKSNWSSIGYLHFGQNHLCGGEFNDVMAHTKEHGLDYYFICLKQYITTANMRDYAGRKVWWYPIYDDNNNFIYCAGLDILRDALMDEVKDDLKQELKNMSIPEFQNWRLQHNISFRQVNTSYDSSNINNFQNRSGEDKDMFLEYLQENNLPLYEEIMKGAV